MENLPIKVKKDLTTKLRENPFILSTIVLGGLTIFLLFTLSFGETGGAISEDKAIDAFEKFASPQISDIEILGIQRDGNFYQISFNSSQTGNSAVYITTDGKYLVTGLIPLSIIEDLKPNNNTDNGATNILKSDVPTAELFVMTHCPYGTQAEKGFIPMMQTLGDLADTKIRFVHYFMHDPEKEETSRQVCIREEQSGKWLDYLVCFLEDGDADRCLTEIGINKDELNDCITNRAEGYYAEDSEFSEDYGVGGSPTLVINGQIISSERSPAAYLDTICQAFNNVPKECETILSNINPSTMWGWDASGSSTTDQC